MVIKGFCMKNLRIGFEVVKGFKDWMIVLSLSVFVWCMNILKYLILIIVVYWIEGSLN